MTAPDDNQAGWPQPTPPGPKQKRPINKPLLIGVALGAFVLGTLVGGAADDPSPAPVAQPTADAPANEQPAQPDAQAAERRAAELDARQAQLDQRQAELDQRAAAVGQQEQAAARAQFGDGVYQVGVDVEPGTYRSMSTEAICYWQQLDGLGGSIVKNGTGEGQQLVAVEAGQAMESHGCGTWQRR